MLPITFKVRMREQLGIITLIGKRVRGGNDSVICQSFIWF